MVALARVYRTHIPEGVTQGGNGRHTKAQGECRKPSAPPKRRPNDRRDAHHHEVGQAQDHSFRQHGSEPFSKRLRLIFVPGADVQRRQ